MSNTKRTRLVHAVLPVHFTVPQGQFHHVISSTADHIQQSTHSVCSYAYVTNEHVYIDVFLNHTGCHSIHGNYSVYIVHVLNQFSSSHCTGILFVYVLIST